MKQPLILTVIGPDRPGLVERLARLVNEHGGNWLESRMARLGGQFAGIVRVLVPGDQHPALQQALQALHQHGLHVDTRPDAALDPAPPSQQHATIEILGQDRPGIVRHLAATLAIHGVNVEELSTEIISAPMTGEPLFKAAANLSFPPSCPLDQLRLDLEKIAHELMVDLKLSRWP
jgi:glycine cleavage system regulatory protein